jgi:hypothetical protein
MIGRRLVSQINFSSGISWELRITRLILSTVFYISQCPVNKQGNNDTREVCSLNNQRENGEGEYFLEFLGYSSDSIIDPRTYFRMPTLKNRSIILPGP